MPYWIEAWSFGPGWALRSWTGAPAFEPRAAFVAAGSGGFPGATGDGGSWGEARTYVTLQDNTKRPDMLDVGANVLAGADALRMI